ncbi:hypothetical protein QBC43DRAFT_369368 [Cladorrhinum sp. PSN259]|nr:hypothetical protein QBC43DRAFT_369368 [Cladorrhinum sp. PSN259]
MKEQYCLLPVVVKRSIHIRLPARAIYGAHSPGRPAARHAPMTFTASRVQITASLCLMEPFDGLHITNFGRWRNEVWYCRGCGREGQGKQMKKKKLIPGTDKKKEGILVLCWTWGGEWDGCFVEDAAPQTRKWMRCSALRLGGSNGIVPRDLTSASLFFPLIVEAACPTLAARGSRRWCFWGRAGGGESKRRECGGRYGTPTDFIRKGRRPSRILEVLGHGPWCRGQMGVYGRR